MMTPGKCFEGPEIDMRGQCCGPAGSRRPDGIAISGEDQQETMHDPAEINPLREPRHNEA